jgi:hypothetical protein
MYELDDYPANTVWYIEAFKDRIPNSARTMGSAVAVELIAPGTDKPRKYLLTCAHCVREINNGRPKGHLLKHVLCWPNGCGYIRFTDQKQWGEAGLRNAEGGFAAEVVDVYNRNASGLLEIDLIDSHDWILLDVKSPKFQDHPCVTSWDSSAKDKISIIGFPDGANNWGDGSIVSSLWQRDYRLKTSSKSPALIDITGGEETARGMSGGGVFGPDGSFIALHRLQTPNSRTFSGIKASFIRSELESHQYEIICNRKRPQSTHRGNENLESNEKNNRISKDAFYEILYSLFSGQYAAATVIALLFLASPITTYLLDIHPPDTSKNLKNLNLITVLLQALSIALLKQTISITRNSISRYFAPTLITLSVVAVAIYGHCYNTSVRQIRSNDQHNISYWTVGDQRKPPYNNTPLSDEELLGSQEGDDRATKIWTEESVLRAKKHLTYTWICMWVFSTLAMASQHPAFHNTKAKQVN